VVGTHLFFSLFQDHLRGSQKLPIERSIGQPIIEKVIGIEDSGK
jgi:hypothetical protein